MRCGKARGKPAYSTAVRIFTSPDVVREGYRREASLRHCGRNLDSPDGVGRLGDASLQHCGRNLSISGWGGGGLGGKPAYGTAVGFFYVSGFRMGCGTARRQPTALR